LLIYILTSTPRLFLHLSHLVHRHRPDKLHFSHLPGPIITPTQHIITIAIIIIAMELSPPALTRSPTPTHNQYCRSERSSVDYPSPILIEQHYKLAPSYSEQQCSMAQPIESEHALPSVESMAPAEWQPSNVIHPASAAGPMQAILSPVYDAYGSYASPMQPSYTHHAYHPQSHMAHHHQHHHQHQHHHVAHPSPVTPHHLEHPASPNSRSEAGAQTPEHHGSPHQTHQHVYGYGPTHESPSPMSARVKMESHYAEPTPCSSSPRSVHTSYVTETTMYADSQPQTYMPEPPTASTWPKAEYGPSTAVLYTAGPAAAQMEQAGVTSLQDAQRVFKLAARHTQKRQPRRLTTREEANFQCEVKGCGKLFSRSYNYKAHMLTHDEKREYPFPCLMDACNKKFVRKTDLQRHNQSVHLKERTHKCDYCTRLFARKDTLRRHMDDGCSKRFDIGTVDIRDAYELAAPNRSYSAPYGHMMPQTTLPPLTLPTSELPPLLAPMPHSMRDRGILASGEHGHDNSWSR
jgi:hypothetical protein